MKLPFKIDSLDGIDAAFHSLYQKDGEGKFTLQVDDDPAKATMTKLRQELADAQKALKTAADEKAAKDREAEEAKARATGDFEKLKEALGAENKALKDQLEAQITRTKNSARDRAALEAITATKGIPKALLPHITPHLEVVADGDDYKVIVKGNPGQKLTDYVASLKNEMAWGFEGSGASGGGAPQGDGGKGGNEPKTSVQLIAAGLKEAGIGK